MAPVLKIARWDHLRASLSHAENKEAALFWWPQYINLRLHHKWGSLLIFINSVIKTKDSTASYKSALSGVHQVLASLPESVEDPVPWPNYRELGKCEEAAAAAAAVIGALPLGIKKLLAIFAVQLCQQAAELTTTVCTLFPKMLAPALLFESRFDWVKWEIQGILSFLYTVIPACLDYGDDSISSKQWRDSIIRGVYIRLGDTAQQQVLCRIQVILVSFPRKSLERQLLRRDNKKHLRLKTKKRKRRKRKVYWKV